MKIDTLKLLNFRSYSTLDINFSNNLNILYGKNGMGKTNLVEAIYFLALTKSFRATNDHNMIMKDKNVTRVEGNIIDNNLKTNYKVILNDDGKTVKIDNNKIDKISNYITKINIILFNPDDLKIIKDSPSYRRKFLNIAISQLNESYLKYLSNYNKILKQRNSYLKQTYINANSSTEYLDILTNKIVDLGLEIFKIRKNYIETINNYLNDYYLKISGSGHLEVKYSSDYDKSKEEILKCYKQNFKRELALGKTIYGIHHDDIIFKLDNNNIRDWGSEGQQKNAIISFKFSEIEIIKQQKNKLPILILDDLFSELDKEKINNIINLINKESQTFITTTDLEKVDKKLLDTAKIFKVDNCNIEEEHYE